MTKNRQQCKCFNLMLFAIFLTISTFFLYKYCSYLSKEGMQSYESMKPSIKVLYKYQSGIEISKLGKHGKCLIIENEIQLCERKEKIYHEMIVHFPVMYLKQPLKNVVIIGGGDLMTLREVMKYYSIEKVFMLELEPKIVNLCEKYFDQSKYDDDQRVEIIYGDANETIDKILENFEDQMDLVVVDTTEDNTNNASIDTPDFFDKCFDLLNETGVIVKNGLVFKELFEAMEDKHTISYNVDIPYFQEKYFFTIVSNEENNIREVEIQKGNWYNYEIKTEFYNPRKHNKFIIYEEYIEDE